MKPKLLDAALGLAACVPATFAQQFLFSSDFSDPARTGEWLSFGAVGTRLITNEQFVVTAKCGPMPTNNPMATHFAYGHAFQGPFVLTNNWTLEGRADLISASQNDVWGSVHFLWNTRGGAGYAFCKDEDEVALMKFWNGTNSMVWFFYEQRPLKNENVTLVLSLTRRDPDLVISTRVLDKDNANALVYERTVVDTPQADPCCPNRFVKGTPSVNDVAREAWSLVSGSGYLELPLDWTNPDQAPTDIARIIYDNAEVRLYESPQLSIGKDLSDAVVISWPLTQTRFFLESASSLIGPWAAPSNPLWRTNAGHNEVTITAHDSVNYFRLRQNP